MRPQLLRSRSRVGEQKRASNCSGDDLSELKPIAFVGSIPTRWECTSCGKKFSLGPMSEQVTNPKVEVYAEFERHKCAAKAARNSAHKSPLHKISENRRGGKDRRGNRRSTTRRATD